MLINSVELFTNRTVEQDVLDTEGSLTRIGAGIFIERLVQADLGMGQKFFPREIG